MGTSRSGVPGKLSVTFGYQDENVKSDSRQVLETKKNFGKKLDFLKRSRFLARATLKNFYFKVILPAVKYGLVLWGS